MNRYTISIAIPLAILVVCLGFSGCGGGASTEPTVAIKPAELELASGTPGDNGPTGPVNGDTEVGSGPGTIVGQILFDGTPPNLSPKVAQGANVKDAEVCAVMAVPNEGLVVGNNGGIANVFVYLDRAPSNYQPQELPEVVTLDQKGCKFIPHALVATTQQKMQFINSDGVAHNTNVGFVRNQIFNATINPNDTTGVTISLSRAEKVPVKTVCDFHAWMECYVFVADHPFVAVTDENGQFTIPDLPAGSHTFRVWHESADFLERSLRIEVKAGEEAKVNLDYNLSNFPNI